MDHSFQLANANKDAIDTACDNLFPGEVLFKFSSSYLAWSLTSRLFTRSLSAWV